MYEYQPLIKNADWFVVGVAEKHNSGFPWNAEMIESVELISGNICFNGYHLTSYAGFDSIRPAVSWFQSQIGGEWESLPSEDMSKGEQCYGFTANYIPWLNRWVGLFSPYHIVSQPEVKFIVVQQISVLDWWKRFAPIFAFHLKSAKSLRTTPSVVAALWLR